MRHRKTHRDLTSTRIYPKGNRFYLFSAEPIQNPATGKVAKWHPLCDIREGADRARELLKAFRPTEQKTTGRLPLLMDEYRIGLLARREKHRPKEHARQVMFKASNDEITRVCNVIAAALDEFNPDQVIPTDVAAFLDQWQGQRMAQVYRARLSDFFKWCVRRGHAPNNPVNQVSVEKPPARDRLLTPEEFHAIRDALLVGKDGRATPSGVMVQCYVDLCYLLYQRTTEIRLLKWSDIDLGRGLIHFKPTKTERSSGAKVAVPITPAIREVLERARSAGVVKSLYVIHNLQGQPYGQHGLGTAWERARERAQVQDAILKDIRAMAATAANKAGFKDTQIQVGLAHTSVGMTDHYIREREAPVSEVVMVLPVRR